MNPSSTMELHVSRLIKAPAARVFAAWTDSGQVARWIGPGEWKITSAEIDLRVGGEFRFDMEYGERRIAMRGVYREIEPPRRLVFTWRQEGEAGTDFADTLVAVDFAEVNGATDVRITHSGFTAEKWRQGHEYGWKQCLAAIEQLLTAEQAPG